MTRKTALDDAATAFIKDHYGTNRNRDIAMHLNFMADISGNKNSRKKITATTIQYYARKFGLKKTHAYQTCKSGRNRSKEVQYNVNNFDFYCGSPMEEVRSVARSSEKLVICASRKQMNDIRYAVYRYNAHDSGKTGIRVKILYDAARLSVVLTPESISSPEPCRTRSSQAGVLYAPP